MSSVLRFALVIGLLIGLGFVSASAQCELPKIQLPEEKPARPEGKLPMPKGDGEVRIRISGTMGDIPLNELIQLYVESSGRPVLWDPKRVRGEVTLTAPTSGHEPDLEELLQTALAQYRMCLVNTGKFDEIVPSAEAATIAEVVSIEELATLPQSRFVRVVVTLNHAEATRVVGAIRNFMSRPAGVAAPIPEAQAGGAIILADTVSNLRRVLVVVEQLDAPRLVSRVITLQHAKLDEVSRAINTAAGPAVSVGVVEAGKQIVLTGSPSEVERVAAVIAQLDQKRG